MSRRLACLLLAALAAGHGASRLAAQAGARPPDVYRPDLAIPDELARFLPYVEPGADAFTSERDAAEIEARLADWGGRLRANPARAADALEGLLAADFRGARLAAREAPSGDAPFAVQRDEAPPPAPTLDARAFGAEIARLVGGLPAVATTEFLVTAIDVAAQTGLARTEVRYDIVGGGGGAWRAQRTGTWRMAWRKVSGAWRVVEWTSAAHVASRASRPVFSEVTDAALGANESFRRQLSTGLDRWMAAFDSVLTRDSNGHHGVSVGDADGDGLEDLYVAQPAGLPNRLFRARGDGTFEDVTDRAGLGVLDDTAQSLFADVDNDGDQDLVLSTGTRLLLFANDGTGRFSPVADAFAADRPLQGVLTSIAMADYDRDGFLDLYVCVYSYFFGAGEDKAGTPAPYHDARNGPPGALFRNDGRGRFVEATKAAGLEEGNDRYHFAAAWADYDDDGWIDLLVANDFGTKNLYRNRGRRNGTVTFEDVSAQAGVLDHGAGMSATFLDYDNDGRLDIYTGNMWSASGRRVTASPAFKPDAPADVRALYRRHARGNALFRNRGDGGFEDTTLAARAEMGRWAWSSDALDFDSDGWEDLYVANGMLTRDDPRDLDGFFWRQVVGRSPLTRVKGTPYDDAWRAINQLLVHQSIASRQRNVFLRNDGRGGFDDVSGAVGLDLDQDGRSFAVLDLEGDGDPDLAVMAARQAPQLRVFRNDLAPRPPALSIRLAGTAGNRDAVGARVTVETDRLRRTKIVQAGSGFLSQHSRTLLFGLGASQRVVKVTIRWPSGAIQELTDVAIGTRVRVTEGGGVQAEPLTAHNGSPEETLTGEGVRDEGVRPPGTKGSDPGDATSAPKPPGAGAGGPPLDATWMYEPFPAPDFSLPDLDGTPRSLSALRGRPAVLLLWSSASAASRAAFDALARDGRALGDAGLGALAIALDPPEAASQVRAASSGPLPVIHATRELGLSYAILYRHLFMNRPALRLPTALLLDAAGSVVRVYHGGVDGARLARDRAAIEASPAERFSRAVPFAGTLHSPVPPRNYLPYGRELLDEGLEAAALVAFERAAQSSPTAFTLYRLGSLLTRRGDAPRARAALERALALQPDLAEANNDLGALLARDGDLEGAIARFRLALASTPDYPDALNNLGYALLLTGREAEARSLYEKALALQPDFPEALNNLGLLLGRAGDLGRAEGYFREALTRRAAYGEAANNLALVLVARGNGAEAVGLLEGFLARTPEYEGAYVTLAKIHLAAGRTREGIGVLERLLQRNPAHPVALELLREWKPR